MKFKKEHPQLKESTVRPFREKYHSSLKAKKVGTAITKKLPSLKRGRPLLLGTIDEKVNNFLFALRQKGGVVNTVVAIATAKALIERSKDEHLKLIDLETCYGQKAFSEEWALSKERLPLPDLKYPTVQGKKQS